MPNRNIELTEHFDHFIEEGIQAGRYANANEAVAEGLRLLEESEAEYQARLDAFNAEAKIGFDELDRGEGYDLKSRDDLRAFMQDIADEVAAEIARERSA